MKEIYTSVYFSPTLVFVPFSTPSLFILLTTIFPTGTSKRGPDTMWLLVLNRKLHLWLWKQKERIASLFQPSLVFQQKGFLGHLLYLSRPQEITAVNAVKQKWKEKWTHQEKMELLMRYFLLKTFRLCHNLSVHIQMESTISK